MSKGYADYLVVLAREIDREFQRGADGVECPLFSNEFKEWLETQKLSRGSKVNYMRWLRKADVWICDMDHDFWTLLKKSWEASDFETAKALCNKYEMLLLNEKLQAEKDEKYGESGKEIGNWVSAFRKYCKFFDDQMQKAEANKKMLTAMIEASRLTSENLFLDGCFILWGILNDLAESTMETYVSDIKRVNRELFSKTGHDILYEYLPGFVKTKNMAKVSEMFAAMDSKLTERIDNMDETEMPVASLENARAAIRKYSEFIKTLL